MAYVPPHAGTRATQQTQHSSSFQPGTGPVLSTVRRQELITQHSLHAENAKITDCEYIASYNWLGRGEPVISVPGMPPRWTPSSAITRLKPDCGEYFVDQNAARQPKHPFEAAMQAVFLQQPEMSLRDIDLIVCGSTLGNLLRYVRNIKCDFRFRVQSFGNVVFLIRQTKFHKEKIEDIQGYGHTYPEANTSWDADLGGSESAQRIIKYNFGGQSILVRFEADAYLADKKEKDVSGFPDLSINSIHETLSMMLPSKPPASANILKIEHRGHHISQNALLDIKTRSSWKKINEDCIIDQELPRLWIRQIPNFLLAWHRQGMFEQPEIRDVRDKLKNWETENQAALRQLGVLLSRIVDFARHGSGKFELVRDGEKIQFCQVDEQNGSQVISAQLQGKWMQRYRDRARKHSESLIEDSSGFVSLDKKSGEDGPLNKNQAPNTVGQGKDEGGDNGGKTGS